MTKNNNELADIIQALRAKKEGTSFLKGKYEKSSKVDSQDGSSKSASIRDGNRVKSNSSGDRKPSPVRGLSGIFRRM